MSKLSGLFRSGDNPITDSTVESAYWFLFGDSASGKMITERSSMQMTAVYSCGQILAEAVAGLSLHVYQYTDGGRKKKALENPLYFLLHDEPNPEMTSFVFREALIILASVLKYVNRTKK